MEKKKIAVLFGGCSTEYSVSLASAYAVICHIDQEMHQVVMIGIARDSGQWYWYQGVYKRILEDTWLQNEDCTPVYLPTDRKVQGLYYLKDGRLRVLSVDKVLPILHGKNGEDGTVQGALELANIPLIGCGGLSSALCMDKEMAHRLLIQHGVSVPRGVLLQKPYDTLQIWSDARTLGYPLFIKPVRSGSSYGITMVQKEEDLIAAIENAFGYDDKVLMEECIVGREVGCSVLGTKTLLTGEVDEIELSEGFFDYTEKYTLKTSKIHVPARISPKVSSEVKRMAKIVYRALHCSGFARVDFFLTEDEKLYFNEVNTIPGFTAHSRFPNMLKASGYTFEEIITRILEEEG